MNLFVIHRFEDRKQVKLLLERSEKRMGASFVITLLDSRPSEWKKEAIEAISKAEAVILYDRSSCEESENAKWEIQRAEESKLPIVEIYPDDTPSVVCSKLSPIYDFKEEFDKCFRTKNGDRSNTLDLYNLMIDSSEALIQRRQKTNAFFITAIGSIFAIAGLIVKIGTLQPYAIWLLCGFSIVGLLLCNSWRNLIDNYGKLNKAKFDVILRLEQDLDAQIFSAEWISLGKGLRPDKYRSFTSTEKDVPLYFSWLILTLTIPSILWYIWTSSTVRSIVCDVALLMLE